jgi:hypothetical protein
MLRLELLMAGFAFDLGDEMAAILPPLFAAVFVENVSFSAVSCSTIACC